MMEDAVLIKPIASEAIKSLFSLLKNTRNQKSEDMTVHIERHLQEIVNWSNRIQMYRISKTSLTDEDTVSLKLRTPINFSDRPKYKREDYLLDSGENILLLGDSDNTHLQSRVDDKFLFVKNQLRYLR